MHVLQNFPISIFKYIYLNQYKREKKNLNLPQNSIDDVKEKKQNLSREKRIINIIVFP